MMYKWLNGNLIEMTDEEISAMQSDQLAAEAEERTRPLTESEVTRLLIAQQINSLSVDDQTAVRMTEFYPSWASGQAYTAGYKVQHGGKLWSCLQAHTSQIGWEPNNAPSLWARVLIPDTDVIPAWEQPDSTNPYSAGDKVTHNGKTWVSDIDNNVWEPGVYGWTETINNLSRKRTKQERMNTDDQ